MKRRRLLATTALGLATPFAGCSATDDGPVERADESPERDDETRDRGTEGSASTTAIRPEECPATRDLGVPLPDESSEAAVVEFVLEYERRYVEADIEDEEFIVTTEPSTERLDVTETDPGIAVTVSTIYAAEGTEDVQLAAEPRETVPEGVEPIDVETLPDEAAAVAEVAREVVADETEAFSALEDREPEPIASALEPARSDEGEYYVISERTPVRIVVSRVGDIHDGAVEAAYYVDEAVVRRNDDARADPRDGELMECFEPAN